MKDRELESRAESLPKIGGLGVAAVGLLIGLTIAARGFAVARAWTPGPSIFLAGILPALLVVAATAGMEKLSSGKGWRACANVVGLGQPNTRQLGIAALCLIPIITAYGVMTLLMGAPLTLQAHLPWLMAKFFVSQGIGEEVVFRGFVFRRLRRGRSFFRAATLSAMVFSIAHLAGLLRGVSTSNLIDVAISLGFTLIMGYAMAHLFEMGNGTIWGGTLLHVGMDSINWFAGVPESQFSASNLAYMTGILAACVIALRARRQIDV